MAYNRTAAEAPVASVATPSMRGYVLFILFMAMAFNFGDRMLVGTLQEPIRAEFHLSDFQLGLLGGPAFALLYTFAGFPIARYCDRGNRVTVIALALGAWSVTTAVCGLAGSFVQLLIARVGVSIGEAGCSPPAQSLIADYFPREKRGVAMSIYATGAPVGMMIAAIVAGYLAQHHGWRYTLFVFGIAGAAMAAITRLTVREPRHTTSGAHDRVGFATAIRTLARKRAFVHTCIGAGLCSVGGTFITQYLTSFLMRIHHLELAHAATLAGAAGSGGGAIGTFLSGGVADRWGRRNPRATVLVPAIGLSLAAVAYWWMLGVASLPLILPFIFIAPALQNTYMGLSYASAQSASPNTMRATAAALFVFANSLFGFGLGPPLFGLLSDRFAAGAMAVHGVDIAACSANSALAGCVAAQGQGLRWSMLAATLMFLLAAIHYYLASRSFVRDAED